MILDSGSRVELKFLKAIDRFKNSTIPVFYGADRNFSNQLSKVTEESYDKRSTILSKKGTFLSFISMYLCQTVPTAPKAGTRSNWQLLLVHMV